MNAPLRRALVLLFAALLQPVAAGASALAAAPFPEVPVTQTSRTSHRWAYATLAAGIALIGISFPLSQHADEVYDEYLVATDPDEIEHLYDEATRYDWYSRGALVGGQVLVAGGLYLRFIRRPRPSANDATLGLEVAPNRCALAWRF